MYIVRSWIFLILWFAWTAIVGIGFSPTLVLSKNHKLILKAGRFWARGTLLILKTICGITSKVIGIENIPNKQFIVASRHESAWETIFFLVLLENPVFIIKKELTKIPIYGWYLKKLGMICIDRSGGINTLKQIQPGVANALESGRPVIIFPEGTRVQPGTIVRLKSGIKFLNENFPLVPIIPISLNSGLFWINKSIMRRSGVIKVKISQEFHHEKDFLDELGNIIRSLH